MSDHEPATADASVRAWLEALAATGPNPGGGAAAALIAGMAAALAEMVATYRLKANPQPSDQDVRALSEIAAAMREAAPSMADQDTAASAGFAAASGRDASPADREAAGLAAAESSAALGRFARRLVPVLRQLAEEAGTFLLSDVGVAASALATSSRAAALNICADLHWAKVDPARRSDLLEALEDLDATAAELDAIAAGVRRRLGPPPVVGPTA